MGESRPTPELAAGDTFRASLLEKVDARLNGCPLWYGWAIMDGFLAGIDWARANSTALPTDAEKLREALEQIIENPGAPVGGTDYCGCKRIARAALASASGASPADGGDR